MAHIVRRQHSTPRVSGQIKAVLDAEIFEKVVELVHKELKCPELFGDVLGVRGLADADLVIEYDRDVKASVDLSEGEDIMVRETGTAVEHYEGSNTRAELTEDLVPGLVRFGADAKVYLPGTFRHYWSGWSLARGW